MEPKFCCVTHCIFDMDGTIMDTEGLYTEIMVSILKDYGKEFTWEEKVAIMGRKIQDCADYLVNHYKLPISWEEFAEVHNERSKLVMANANLMPGADRLLRHLYAHKIPMCLATSSSIELVNVKRTNHQEIFSFFNHIVSGASDPEVKTGKPAPDIFLISASRFPDKPKPCKCLVFEDAPNGVKGARAAGMQCVMTPDEQVSEEDRSLATQVINNLNDFIPEQFGLPAYNK